MTGGMSGEPGKAARFDWADALPGEEGLGPLGAEGSRGWGGGAGKERGCGLGLRGCGEGRVRGVG